MGHENLNHPDAERIQVISNVCSMCCYTKATSQYQLKLGRVTLIVTLVSIPNDWTFSGTLVTFRGPYLAAYWVDENAMNGIFSEHTAKKLEQALDHQAVSIDDPVATVSASVSWRLSKPRWAISKSSRASCSSSKTLPVAEPFANDTRTIKSPKTYGDR